METLQQQIDAKTTEIQGLENQSPQNAAAIETANTELANLKAQLDQEAAASVRIQQEVKRDAYTLPTDFDAFFSNSGYLDGDGNPYVQTSANKIILQVVKDALAANDEEHNAELTETETAYKAQVTELQTNVSKLTQDNQTLSTQVNVLQAQLAQANLEKQDAEAKRDAAVNEKKQLEVKESADLADLIAQETAEKEKKAAEDKVKRTVYDVTPDSDINPKNYTAKLASTGETVTFNWTQKNFYTVLTDPNEIEQFRTQNATQTATEPTVQDTPLVIPEALHVTEGTIPSQIEAPALQTVSAPMVEGVSSTDGQGSATVTKEEHEALKARVVTLENKLNTQAVA